jgi:hypothetical protein
VTFQIEQTEELEMKVTKLPPTEVLHQLFEEKEPGVLYNRLDRGAPAGGNGKAFAGAVAGHDRVGGYWRMMVNKIAYNRSRVIWKMHHGVDPQGVIDHINGDSYDDRIENLRDVVFAINSRNRGRRDGRYVTYGEYIDPRRGDIHDVLRFGINLWPDEDVETIQQELHDAIAPIVDRIYDNRRGRQRPSRQKAWLPTPAPVNGNARTYRRY